MNTLLESTTRENLKSSDYSRHTDNECCVGYEHTRSSDSSFAMAEAISETVQSRASVRAEKRPLAPSKPPMRLEGKRMR